MATRRTDANSTPSGTAYLIGRLHRMLQRRMGEALAPVGLTLQQYTVLAMIGARGQLSNAQLAERAFVTPQTANEVVKTMEASGWIKRTPDPHHGRIIQLRLTAAGRHVLSDAHALTAMLEERMLAGLDAASRLAFNEQLKSSIQALSLTMIDTQA